MPSVTCSASIWFTRFDFVRLFFKNKNNRVLSALVACLLPLSISARKSPQHGLLGFDCPSSNALRHIRTQTNKHIHDVLTARDRQGFAFLQAQVYYLYLRETSAYLPNDLVRRHSTTIPTALISSH